MMHQISTNDESDDEVGQQAAHHKDTKNPCAMVIEFVRKHAHDPMDLPAIKSRRHRSANYSSSMDVCRPATDRDFGLSGKRDEQTVTPSEMIQ